MIIDGHAHVFLPASEDLDRPVDDIAPPEREARLDLLKQEQAAVGVDGAVLVPLGFEDDYIARAVADEPARFRAIAVAPAELTDLSGAKPWASSPNTGSSVGSQDPDALRDPGRLSDRLSKGGFSGLRLFALPGRVEERPPWLPALERLQADNRVLWIYPRAQDLPTLNALAVHLPELTIALNHTGLTQAGIGVDDLGRPRIDSEIPQAHEDQVLALARHPNVSVLLSGAYGFSREPYPYVDVADVTRRVAAAFGVERLVWASDFPWILEQPGYRACLELLDHHLPGLSPGERDAILGGNVRRLLAWERV